MSRLPITFLVLLTAGVLVSGTAGGASALSNYSAGLEPGAHGGEHPTPGERLIGTVETDTESPAVGVLQRITYSLDPSNESAVELRVDYRAGRDVTGLVLFPPERATLMSTTAFDLQENGRLYTGENFDNASATFRIELPRETVDDHWGQGVATREWAVVGGLPGTAYYSAETDQWEHDDGERVTRELGIDGNGTVGSRSVVLGNHTVHEGAAGAAEIRLVTIDENSMARPPDEVFGTLAFAARTMDVGDQDETLLVVHIPVESTAVKGTTFSERDGRQDLWLYAAGWGLDNTWLHEYVHTRQTYDLAEDMRWFEEASANYYEKLFALRAGVGSYAGFRERIQSANAGGVLSEPTRWKRGTQYVRGQRVLAALDARIRAETEYERSLADVFRLVNDHEGTVTLAEFSAYASQVAGTDMDDWIQANVAGTADAPFVDNPYAYTDPSGEEDPDEDGLTDATERDLGTHPFLADTDQDGLDDSVEVDRETDPTVADTDDDGLRDGVEVARETDPTVSDTDGDGLGDGVEVERGTDPMVADTDDDGLADGQEVDLETDPTSADTDADGLADGREVELGTDPGEPDTDGDGLADGAEFNEYGTDPTESDTDTDGLSDRREADLGTDPTVADTDDDGLRDGVEVERGTDPTVADTDEDGLIDGDEITEYGTDPSASDTDGDGFSDPREVSVGTDPTESTKAIDFWVARAGGPVVVVGLGAVGGLVTVAIVVGLVVWRLRR